MKSGKRKKNKEQYYQYLRSSKWKKFREAAMTFYGDRCGNCGGKYNIEVHHKTYRNIFKETLGDVMLLCNGCHQRTHRGKRKKNIDTNTVTYYPGRTNHPPQMITLKQEEKLIDRLKSLTELELESVFKEICRHMRRERMEHIISNVLDPDDFEGEVERLEDRISELESDNDEKTQDLATISSICEEAEEIEDFEDSQKQIEQLKDIIERIDNICP